MNPDRKVFGRMTLNGTKIDLGRANFSIVMQRLMEQYRNKRYEGEKLQIIVEIADDPLPATSIMSRDEQIAHEFANLPMAAPDEEAFPGVTMQRVAEVMSDPLYDQWNELCKPDNRIGIPQSHIDSIRDQYRTQFPDCFDHFPVWK